ncbi:MAG: DUF2911 domain-containing protein [Ignavibacteria bacterium]|nr:DUF2911 domain-containing protein [Ignavibacteria bacterium]
MKFSSFAARVRSLVFIGVWGLIHLSGLFSSSAFAQHPQSVTLPDILTFPQASQRSQISQRIGITDITISYHSPAAKGRTIWGGVVPLGKVWRAGANANTTIAFAHDVKINGNNLPKGIYGFHLLPQEKDWVLIFSKDYQSWGSEFYSADSDALRVSVTPENAENREYLAFDFLERSENTTTIMLHWGTKRCIFKVDVDTKAIVAENIRKEMRSDVFWNGEETFKAASYFVNNNIADKNVDTWLQQSMRMSGGAKFKHLALRSQLLKQSGNTQKADSVMNASVKKADDNEVAQYAGDLVFLYQKYDDAIAMLNASLKLRPDSWYTLFAMGRLSEEVKRFDDARTYFKQSQAKAPAENKGMIAKALERIEKR